MATSAAVETGLDKLSAALKEMGARCYCKSTPVSHGCIATVLHYYTPKSNIIVEVDNDGGFEVYAPVEKANSVDATISALKAL